MTCDNPIQLLTSLPYNYTVDIAVDNHDVLRTPEGKSFNIDLLYSFIENVNRNVKDCIRITYFGLDGPAQTSILQFNGDTITLFIDNSRYSEVNNDIIPTLLLKFIQK